MGYTQIPEQAQRGRNKAVIELDKSELTQTINVLQKVLVHVNTHTNTLPKFPSHPPSSIPDFLTARISAPSRQSSISPVTVITPSVAALQQRLGLDLGSGLGLGPVGTFSTESTRYNDNGSTPSSFSSSSSILTIPPIGPPLGTSRPGPIGRPSAISMQGPLPGLQSHFGQLGFRSGELGSGDLTSRSLDIGCLSLGQAGLPPVRVSTGQVGSLSLIGIRGIWVLLSFLQTFSGHDFGLFQFYAQLQHRLEFTDLAIFILISKLFLAILIAWVVQWFNIGFYLIGIGLLLNLSRVLSTWTVAYKVDSILENSNYLFLLRKSWSMCCLLQLLMTG